MEQLLWLLPLGFLVGTLGTIIGIGGGFILVPLLLLLYPEKSPETITSISLAVVFFNSLSGSVAYARMKRIDYKSGLMFAIATLPGSILGSLTTAYIPRSIFSGLFGLLLLSASIYLLLHSENSKRRRVKPLKVEYLRQITDIDGTVHRFSYNPVTGVLISLFVGFISSILGIGGGIIHVPVLIQVLGFPVHIATATSHFVLVIMSFSGSVVHLVNGTLADGVLQTIAISVGVLIGAQLGATLSKKVRGVWIIRGLAIGLGIVGVRIFMMLFI